MNPASTRISPIGIDAILHPSDFTEASDHAFIHALKIALATRAKLTLLHATEDPDESWEEFPSVRETLERWGLLKPGSHRREVVKLGISVQKLMAHGPDSVQAVLNYVAMYEVDLIVLATHPHEGQMRWLHPSAAEPIARQSHDMTLFVPQGVKGFVAWKDGTLSLRRVLLPVAADPSSDPAVRAAYRLVQTLGCENVEFHLLHVGSEEKMPELALPEGAQGQWHRIFSPGPMVETVLEVAREISADLVAMTTDEHHDFLAALRGNATERVLRQAGCPLLAVPAQPAGFPAVLTPI